MNEREMAGLISGVMHGDAGAAILRYLDRIKEQEEDRICEEWSNDQSTFNAGKYAMLRHIRRGLEAMKNVEAILREPTQFRRIG